MSSIQEKTENFFKEQLAKAKIAHADETGMKVNGINRWIHSFSNDKFTVLTSHRSRGKKAIIEAGILPNFHGILTHDCWYAYDSFDITHAICCAHLLRELNYLEEKTELNAYLEYVCAVEKGYEEEKRHCYLPTMQLKEKSEMLRLKVKFKELSEVIWEVKFIAE